VRVVIDQIARFFERERDVLTEVPRRTWHVLQNAVERPPITTRAILEPHLGHGWPA
jgi:hypothetical protein